MIKRPVCEDDFTSLAEAALTLNLKVPLPPSFHALSLKVYRLAREENNVFSSSSPVSTSTGQLRSQIEKRRLTILMLKSIIYLVVLEIFFPSRSLALNATVLRLVVVIFLSFMCR